MKVHIKLFSDIHTMRGVCFMMLLWKVGSGEEMKSLKAAGAVPEQAIGSSLWVDLFPQD